jgi:hypothetical protein
MHQTGYYDLFRTWSRRKISHWCRISGDAGSPKYNDCLSWRFRWAKIYFLLFFTHIFRLTTRAHRLSADPFKPFSTILAAVIFSLQSIRWDIDIDGSANGAHSHHLTRGLPAETIMLSNKGNMDRSRVFQDYNRERRENRSGLPRGCWS